MIRLKNSKRELLLFGSILIILFQACQAANDRHVDFNLSFPILFKGDSFTAYRDPAVLYHQELFYLYFTLVEQEPNQRIYSYTAMSTSPDLVHWDWPNRQ
jgi:hypothetical protein